MEHAVLENKNDLVSDTKLKTKINIKNGDKEQLMLVILRRKIFSITLEKHLKEI